MKKATKMIALILAASAAFCTTGCGVSMGVFKHADKYTSGDFSTEATVKDLDIDWTSGSVTVSHHAQSEITVRENCNAELKDREKLQTWLDGSTLHIRFCKPGVNFNLKNAKKNLEILLPEGMELNELDCDCTSADTKFTDIAAESISADLTSGSLQLLGCSAGKFTLDTTSGDITVEQKGKADSLLAETTSGKITVTAGTVGQLKLRSTSGDSELRLQQGDAVTVNCTSGSSVLHLDTLPASVKISKTSGDVALYVPENADFKAIVDMTSGKFDSDIMLKKDGNTYIAGSGSNQINIDTTSGDISIRSEG